MMRAIKHNNTRQEKASIQQLVLCIITVLLMLVCFGCQVVNADVQTCKQQYASEKLDAKEIGILSSARRYELISLIKKGVYRGPAQDDYSYPINKQWSSIAANHPYYAYDLPHLAWMTATPAMSLYYAYCVTDDACIMRQLEDLCDAMLAQRDDKKNRHALDGKTYPIWSSTARYSGGSINVITESGIELGRIHFVGPGHDRTLVTIESEQKPNLLTIKISNSIADKSYIIKDVSVADIPTRIKEEIDWTYYGSCMPDSDVVFTTGFDCETPEGDKVHCIEDAQIESANVPMYVHTGLLLHPMIKLMAEMEKNDPVKAEMYNTAISESMGCVIDLCWNEGGYLQDINCDYLFGGGGVIGPWNQGFEFISALAEYNRMYPNEKYEQIIISYCSNFMKHVTKNSDGTLVWRYWEDPTDNITWSETTNYGGLDFLAIKTIFDAGLYFTGEQISAFALTLDRNILLDRKHCSTHIDATGYDKDDKISLIRYLSFGQYVPDIFTFIDARANDWQTAAWLLYWSSLDTAK